MGNQNEYQLPYPLEKQKAQLEFYSEITDPKLGKVKIYKHTSTNKKMNYIVKYRDRCEDTTIYNIFKEIQLLQSSALIQLYGFNVETKTVCNRILYQNVTSYWNYYNCYFNEYISKRIICHNTFIDSQIWHILDNLCDAYNILRKFGIYYDIDPGYLLVSPQGRLKAMWCHLKTHNRHLKFLQFFESNCEAQFFYYSPQQLENMYKRQKYPQLDFDKCNSFRVGMILLKCLSLIQPLHTCYNASITQINFLAIRRLINYYVVPKYPDQIYKPFHRPSLHQISSAYQKNFNAEFQLKIVSSSTKSREATIDKKGQHNDTKNYKSLQKISFTPSQELSQKTVKIKR